MSLVGRSVEELDTPSLLVDCPTFQANVRAMTTTLNKSRCGWRPHAKAHKSPAVAHLLLEAGAHGITCAKVSEAEVYAHAGIRDILIANQVVGRIKTRRLAHLAREADIAVAVDSWDNALEHEAAAKEAGSSPRLVIEVNSGMERAGVLPGQPMLELAKKIVTLEHVRFGGVMTWEGHVLGIADPAAREAAVRSSLRPVLEGIEEIRAAGVDVPVVSFGGTGTFLTTSGIEGVTEVQAGGGIFGDRFYRNLGVPVNPALSLLVTVTSRPNPTRIIVDAGRKSIDPSNTLPEWPSLGEIKSQVYSAEHGTLEMSTPSEVEPGTRLRAHVGYSDQAIHLHEALYVIENDQIVAVWPTLARGCIQ